MMVCGTLDATFLISGTENVHLSLFNDIWSIDNSFIVWSVSPGNKHNKMTSLCESCCNDNLVFLERLFMYFKTMYWFQVVMYFEKKGCLSKLPSWFAELSVVYQAKFLLLALQRWTWRTSRKSVWKPLIKNSIIVFIFTKYIVFKKLDPLTGVFLASFSFWIWYREIFLKVVT